MKMFAYKKKQQKKPPKTLHYDQFAFPKTKIMLQKTLKYKLATIKLAVFNSL